jgi:hypothetical protein
MIPERKEESRGRVEAVCLARKPGRHTAIPISTPILPLKGRESSNQVVECLHKEKNERMPHGSLDAAPSGGEVRGGAVLEKR